MSFRVGIAGFMHESNTFANTKTTRAQFEEAFLHYGADLIPVWREAYHELGGFIEGGEEQQLEIVPLMAAWATPGGTLTEACYEEIIEELLDSVQQAGKLDGILLALHGAMVAEHHSNADGETLERLRKVVGPDLPLMLTLDMHGNLSPRMAELPEVTIAYRSYPHVAQRQRGIECARIMAQTLRGAAHPVQAYRKLPLLIHIVQQFTGEGAMAELIAALETLERDPKILSASILPGYIYADVQDMGVAVVVVADGDEAYAQEKVQALSDFVYAKRYELNADLPSVEEAVTLACATEGTVCLMDSGDNIGGGGPGDATIIFDALLEAGMDNICAVLYDPESAQACAEAGINATITLSVGAKTDHEHGAPITVTGKVITLHDGHFTEPEPRHGGIRDYDQGLTAVIETGSGHTVIVNSLRVMPTSLQQLLSLNINPRAHRAIIVKGVTAPRVAYDPIADKVICVDSPGVTRAGPEAFVYHHRPHPLFPLDSKK